MAEVHLDQMLREFGARPTVAAEGPDVKGLLDALEAQYPRLQRKLRNELGEMRPFVRVFVNGQDIRGLRGLETPVAASDRVDILHSVAGG